MNRLSLRFTGIIQSPPPDSIKEHTASSHIMFQSLLELQAFDFA
jgi:hypothetical protein